MGLLGAAHPPLLRAVPPTPVMEDLKAIVGDKDYFVVTSNGECHFELCGFDPEKIYEIEGNWLTMQCARPCHDTRYPSLELAEKLAAAEQDGLHPRRVAAPLPRVRRAHGHPHGRG